MGKWQFEMGGCQQLPTLCFAVFDIWNGLIYILLQQNSQFTAVQIKPLPNLANPKPLLSSSLYFNCWPENQFTIQTLFGSVGLSFPPWKFQRCLGHFPAAPELFPAIFEMGTSLFPLWRLNLHLFFLIWLVVSSCIWRGFVFTLLRNNRVVSLLCSSFFLFFEPMLVSWEKELNILGFGFIFSIVWRPLNNSLV